MSQIITFQTVIDRLSENAIAYSVLELQGSGRIIIAERGGRIFGPFLDSESACLFWINPAFADAVSFRQFLDSGHWNLGGERLWIAPELQYNVGNPDDFFGAYDLPSAIDPGHYALITLSDTTCLLQQDITLNARFLNTGTKALHIRRHIQTSANPLRSSRHYADLMVGVRFVGYEHSVLLEEYLQDTIMSETWTLIQVHPGGEVLIPTYSAAEFADYYEAAGELQQVEPHGVRLKITGDQRYKLGYASACLCGRFGYLTQISASEAVLLVRNFPNNPAVPYVEGPSHTPAIRGHSLHVYNDDGGFGGFGELECQGQPIGGETGAHRADDIFTLWCFAGPPQQINRIAQTLLGIEP